MTNIPKRRQRYSYEFNDSLINNNEYLKKNILPTKMSNKFLCDSCKRTFNKSKVLLFESLSHHLESANHKKTATTEVEKNALEDAIKYMRESVKMEKVSKDAIKTLEENKESYDEKMEEELEVAEEKMTKEPNLPKCNNQFYFRFQITNFIIQNNLPFSISDKISKFIKLLIDTHTPISLSNFTVNPKHVNRIISKCFGPSIKESYLSKLKETFFSISLDEGSIKGNVEYLAVSARFFETESDERTVTKLLDLIQLEGCTKGKTLYDLIESSLFSGNEGKERKKNLMGISTDHTSNMISGKDKGLTNRFEKDLPHLVVVHDICHALNLVLESCIESFPKDIKKIVSDIASMFSRSPQHTSKFKQLLQKERSFGDKSEEKKQELNNNVRSIVRYVETRWSSFHDALGRIVELSEPLKKYIELETKSTSKKRQFLTKRNMIMLRLLLCLVGLVNDYIKEFQKENMNMMEIVETLKECHLLFAEYIFNLQEGTFIDGRKFKDYIKLYENLTPLLQKDVDQLLVDSYMKNDQEFRSYFLNKHSEFKNWLEEVIEEDVEKDFFEAASNFLQKAFNGIKKKLPSCDSILFSTECFLLKDQLSLDKMKTLAERFKNVIHGEEVGMLNKELNKLGYHVEDIHKKIAKIGFFEAWKQAKTKYPLVYKLMRATQTLPYSSVSIERAFSSALNIKTLKRNQLNVESLKGCLLVKQNFNDKELEFTQDLINRYEDCMKRETETNLQEEVAQPIQVKGEDQAFIENEEGPPTLSQNENSFPGKLLTFESEELFLQAAERTRFLKYIDEYLKSDNEKRERKRKATEELISSDVKQMKKITTLKNSNTMTNAMELEDEDKDSYFDLNSNSI